VLALWAACAPTGNAQAVGPAACRVRVPITVNDPSAPQPEDFLRVRIRSRDKTVKVVATQAAKGSRRVVVLLDLSGSMATDHPIVGDDIWEEARSLAREFLAAMQPEDWAALHIFATRHEVVIPLTQDVGSVMRALDELPKPASEDARVRAGYYTDAVGAVGMAVDQTKQLESGDVILLISDGQGNTGRMEMGPLAADLSGRGLRVSLLRVGPEPDFRFPNALRMTQFAWQTGGFTLSTWNARVVVPGYERRISEQPPPAERVRGVARVANHMLRGFSWVELEFARCDGKPRELKLELRDERGRRVDERTVLYPRYVAAMAKKEELANQ